MSFISFKENRQLEILNLNHNQINKLDVYAFEGLFYLDELCLAFNHLKHLNTNTFSPLKNLKNLNLSFNFLNKFESDLLFNGLYSLTSLDLSSQLNGIQFIHDKLFNGLFNLKYLNLANNKLVEINFLHWINTNSIRVVNLANNSLILFNNNNNSNLNIICYLLSNNFIDSCKNICLINKTCH